MSLFFLISIIVKEYRKEKNRIRERGYPLHQRRSRNDAIC